MGYPHDKATHHFLLYSDGGAIEVTVNDSKDSENMHAIQSRLTHIVRMFAAGDFSMPIFVHDQVPPGVLVMKGKHAEIFTASKSCRQVDGCALRQRMPMR
jgi:hypothetical protein